MARSPGPRKGTEGSESNEKARSWNRALDRTGSERLERRWRPHHVQCGIFLPPGADKGKPYSERPKGRLPQRLRAAKHITVDDRRRDATGRPEAAADAGETDRAGGATGCLRARGYALLCPESMVGGGAKRPLASNQ